MTKPTKRAKDAARLKALREAFQAMGPHKAQEIREAFYKAVEGLASLEEELGRSTDPALKPEYLVALSALVEMRLSNLGRVL